MAEKKVKVTTMKKKKKKKRGSNEDTWNLLSMFLLPSYTFPKMPELSIFSQEEEKQVFLDYFIWNFVNNTEGAEQILVILVSQLNHTEIHREVYVIKSLKKIHKITFL